MPEPDWKARQENRLTNLQQVFPEALGLHALAQALVNVEVEAAYQRGLMAGRSQAGYRKNKNGGGVCPTCLSATDATESSASAGEP